MNANKNLIAVSTIAAAFAASAVAFSASAEDHRGPHRGSRPAVVVRQAPPAVVRHADFRRAQPKRVVVERKTFRHRPPVVHTRTVIVQQPVIVQRPVVVHRPVYVNRTVFVERPVYYHEPAPAYSYEQDYYAQPVAYVDSDANVAGTVAGAVIGGVIGSQIGHGGDRGIATVIGAVFGGILGSNF